MFEIDSLINPTKLYEIFQTYNMYIFDRFLAVTFEFQILMVEMISLSEMSRERIIFCIIYIFK